MASAWDDGPATLAQLGQPSETVIEKIAQEYGITEAKALDALKMAFASGREVEAEEWKQRLEELGSGDVT